MRKRLINIEEPTENKVGKRQSISFSFDMLHEVSYTECKRTDFFIHLLQRMKKLSLLDWNSINHSQRHSFGYEKIPIKAIRKNILLTKDMDYLFVFRATGDNHVFLGFREGNVFKVVFIEAEFGDIYNHG